jgi:murein DD-endopeptidase MepM/ murein hydrolase activator NlpD
VLLAKNRPILRRFYNSIFSPILKAYRLFTSQKNPYSKYRLNGKWVVALIALISVSPTSPGIFDVLAVSPLKDTTYNSQTIPLLESSLTRDPVSSIGGADIVTVADSALVAESGPSGTIANVDPKPVNPGLISIYVVREGDTLSDIAQMFDVSVNTIRWANDLKGPINTGQSLVILPISGVQHIVKQGDTLQSVAKEYKGDVDEVMSFNGLSLASNLEAGMIITIPDGEKVEVVVETQRPVVASGSAPTSGWLMRPINGGRRTQGIHGFNAVDIAAPIGTPVFAAATGNVIVSRSNGAWNGGYGNYVVIKHDNGVQTLYSHLNSAIVNVGQRVVQGQVIGYVGNTGKSTGPHLHFEVRGARNPF